MVVESVLDTITIFLSIFSGIVVGFTLGLIGGGGSVLAVPLLLYVVGVKDIHSAIGTSALAVGVIAAINLIGHRKKGNLKFKKGFYFALPGLGGTLFGAQLGLWTPPENLLFFFAIFMSVVGALMLKRKVTKYDVAKNTGNSIVLFEKNILISGFFVGMVAGYFGIGGGFLIVPSLMYFGGLSIFEAIGTSLMSVSSFGLVTATSYFISENVDIQIATLFVIGGSIGGILGIKITDKISKKGLTKIFAVLLFVISGYIVLRSFVF